MTVAVLSPAGNRENQEGIEDPVFVCEPGNEVSINSLCDGIDDCGGGNDETTALCESQAHVSLTHRDTHLSLSPSQTSAGCHIMGGAPTLDGVLHQNLMSTVEAVSQGSSKILIIAPDLQTASVSCHIASDLYIVCVYVCVCS